MLQWRRRDLIEMTRNDNQSVKFFNSQKISEILLGGLLNLKNKNNPRD